MSLVIRPPFLNFLSQELGTSSEIKFLRALFLAAAAVSGRARSRRERGRGRRVIDTAQVTQSACASAPACPTGERRRRSLRWCQLAPRPENDSRPNEMGLPHSHSGSDGDTELHAAAQQRHSLAWDINSALALLWNINASRCCSQSQRNSCMNCPLFYLVNFRDWSHIYSAAGSPFLPSLVPPPTSIVCASFAAKVKALFPSPPLDLSSPLFPLFDAENNNHRS